ncbi:MAG: ATP-binding cassette domain-containing protein [Candidatus Cloacimonetes bacterium]|nr:ATP-binding cassette domain-containing protein [Candidatus Cloacimonadota bacterium]
MSKIIEVNDLITEYNGERILDGVSLSIDSGSIFAILGGSGCGKTTLLKHIIGLLYPVSGSIKIFGRETVGMEEKKFEQILEKCGMLFQEGALLNSLSVKENIAIPLRQHTYLDEDIIQRVVRTKLHLVELDYALNLYPSELSGGMKKRVAMARAIAMDPKILFCDEPSAGLDPVTTREIDNLLNKLREQLDMTIVAVTHVIDSVRRIADEIVFLHDGQILFTGSFEEATKSDIPQIKEFFQDQNI